MCTRSIKYTSYSVRARTEANYVVVFHQATQVFRRDFVEYNFFLVGNFRDEKRGRQMFWAPKKTREDNGVFCRVFSRGKHDGRRVYCPVHARSLCVYGASDRDDDPPKKKTRRLFLLARARTMEHVKRIRVAVPPKSVPGKEPARARGRTLCTRGARTIQKKNVPPISFPVVRISRYHFQGHVRGIDVDVLRTHYLPSLKKPPPHPRARACVNDRNGFPVGVFQRRPRKKRPGSISVVLFG